MGSCEQFGKFDFTHRVLRYAAGCDKAFSISDVIADLPGLVAPEDAVRIASFPSSRCPRDADTATRIAFGARSRVACNLSRFVISSRILERVGQGLYRITDVGKAYLNYLDAAQRAEEARLEYRRLKPFTRKARGTDSHHQA